MKQSNKTLANRLIAQGFDQTYISQSGVRPLCSKCEALVINGIATHETGCSNVRHECAGCNNLVARHHRYCEDCL